MSVVGIVHSTLEILAAFRAGASVVPIPVLLRDPLSATCYDDVPSKYTFLKSFMPGNAALLQSCETLAQGSTFHQVSQEACDYDLKNRPEKSSLATSLPRQYAWLRMTTLTVIRPVACHCAFNPHTSVGVRASPERGLGGTGVRASALATHRNRSTSPGGAPPRRRARLRLGARQNCGTGFHQHCGWTLNRTETEPEPLKPWLCTSTRPRSTEARPHQSCNSPTLACVKDVHIQACRRTLSRTHAPGRVPQHYLTA